MRSKKAKVLHKAGGMTLVEHVVQSALAVTTPERVVVVVGHQSEQVKAALVKAVPGDVIICHMNHPESGTGAGIMAAVPELQRRGFRFVRMSDYPLK